MSRDVITVGSTMRIPLLYRGEYSQWRERFMNYLKEQTDGEAMINSIQNGDHSLPVVAQVNDTAKDLWDALERQMRGSEYGEQDRKAKCGYKKDNCELNYKFLNNLQPEWKQYGDVNDALGYKKKGVVVTLDPLALVAEKTKVSKLKEKVVVQSESEGSDDKDISDLKKITALLEKAFNRKKYYAKPTNNNLRTSSASSSVNKKPEYVKSEEKKKNKKANEKKRTKLRWSPVVMEINANMVFMAKMEKVLSDSDESSSSADETVAEVAYYTSDSESEFEYETSEYYDNSTNYGLFVNDDDDQENFHNAIESASENFNEYHIVFQKDCDESEVDHNDSEEKDHLVDKLIRKFNQKIAKCHKCFENPSYFGKAKDLRPSIYDERVIGLGYTSMFLTHSDEALEIEKFKRARENKIKFAYNYRNPNASYVNEKINFSDEKIIIDLEDEVVNLLEKEKENLEIIESLKLKGFESSENAISESENQSENNCQVVEKGCDQVENSKVIAPGMFKLIVSQSVSPISASKTSCASNIVENKTKRKRRKRTSSKQIDIQVNNNVLRANRDFVYFLDLDTLSSVRRPKHSSVIWKKKGSSNTYNDDFAYDCNDDMNVSCNSRLYASYDENDLFIFYDESVRNSQVSKMPFKKKPRDSLNVRSKSNSNKSLARTVHICYLLNDYDDVGKLKEKEDIGVFVGYTQESDAFRIYNKRTHKIHESVNVNFDEISKMVSKQFSLEPGLSNLNETEKSSNPSVSQVLETSKKDLEDLFHNFYDEYFDASKIMKSSTMNVETSNVKFHLHEEKVFHESFESFQENLLHLH
nr:integrase, catalytic region, zinc finger, CCHC-type, peptidase aspartic, catalytic [Tanacetum cinerariifolium]